MSNKQKQGKPKAKLDTKKFLKASDFTDVLDGFASEAERIKYMNKTYAQAYGIKEAFEKFYGIQLEESKEAPVEKMTTELTVGGCYYGEVSSISKAGTVFLIQGVKDEIFSKETFSDCIDSVQNYLLTHENKLRFEVREHKNGRYLVSVMNGYYRMWKDFINAASDSHKPISVHIDSLTQGGYMCHTPITSINELTGKNYTNAVFIPGSNIVLNIEKDFERWVGQDVEAIPQKFSKYRTPGQPDEVSVVASRKKALQWIGMQNIFDIYNRDQLMRKTSVKYTPEVFDGKVTGIIDSEKKCGLFVELEDKCITGLLPVPESKILDWKPGDSVKVSVREFEVKKDKEAFITNKKTGALIWSNTRLVFQFA